MLKRNVLTILLLLLLAGYTTCKVAKASEDGDEPPIVLDSYATESVRPGGPPGGFFLKPRMQMGTYIP